MKKGKAGKCASGYKKGRGTGRATDDAIVWLKDYAFYHADRMPDSKDMMLPYKTRKLDIYNKYLDEKTESMQCAVSKTTFFELWSKRFKNLKIKRVSKYGYQLRTTYVSC